MDSYQHTFWFRCPVLLIFKFIISYFCHRKTSLWAIVHWSNVILGAIESPITSLTIVYSTVYSDADQRKHQSSASLAFVRGIHRWPVNSTHKGPVTRKMFPFDDVIMDTDCSFNKYIIVSDTRFRHLFHQSYQSHEHGYDLAWMLVDDMIALPSVWARSLVHCALLCKEMPTCTGISFDQEPDTPCHMEARV